MEKTYAIKNYNNHYAVVYGYQYGHCTLIMKCTYTSELNNPWEVEVPYCSTGYNKKEIAEKLLNGELKLNVYDYTEKLAEAIVA